MAISKIGGTGSDNWELISSVTPTAASAAVNFTGLSTYRKLMVVWYDLVLGSSGTVSLRLNNDSGSKYMAATSGGTGKIATEISASSSTTGQNGFATFIDCDTASTKSIAAGQYASFTGSTPVGSGYALQGIYLASASITQVNLITSTTFTAVGTVALYGVK